MLTSLVLDDLKATKVGIMLSYDVTDDDALYLDHEEINDNLGLTEVDIVKIFQSGFTKERLTEVIKARTPITDEIEQKLDTMIEKINHLVNLINKDSDHDQQNKDPV